MDVSSSSPAFLPPSPALLAALNTALQSHSRMVPRIKIGDHGRIAPAAQGPAGPPLLHGKVHALYLAFTFGAHFSHMSAAQGPYKNRVGHGPAPVRPHGGNGRRCAPSLYPAFRLAGNCCSGCVPPRSAAAGGRMPAACRRAVLPLARNCPPPMCERGRLCPAIRMPVCQCILNPAGAGG